jgi:hypothetical protein
MAEPVKSIGIAEFRELGFLQELNRTFLHPLGMALEVVIEECERCGGDGVEKYPPKEACTGCDGAGFTERLGRIWDYRDDPEGMEFGPGYGLDPEKAAYVDAERGNRAAHRLKLFGLDELPTFHWAVQPFEPPKTESGK